MLKILRDKEFDLNSFLQKRSSFPSKIENKVKNIISNIKKNGDKALIEYCKTFDNTILQKTGFKTSGNKIREGYIRILKKDPFYIETLKITIKRISDFHKKQIEKSSVYFKNNDETLGQLVTPIEKILIYTPGGNALYPSTLIMNIIPAQCAGVKNIYITTPVKNNQPVRDELLAALYLLKIKEIYHCGGAQAIAAFTFGTARIPKVYKIFGPGNIYVAAAKKLVYGIADIDMIAGPTEILIIAGKKNNPEYIALDMLAQAEHDSNAVSILLTDSLSLAEQTGEKIRALLKEYRSDIAMESIKRNGLAIIVKEMKRAFDISNEIAPEHLEILLPSPKNYLSMIKNAGSIFLGMYTPQAIGDYFGGPNHTLPTMGTAKFYSQLGVYDFIKHTGFTFFSKKKLNESKKYIEKMAQMEKLKFHGLSVKLR